MHHAWLPTSSCNVRRAGPGGGPIAALRGAGDYRLHARLQCENVFDPGFHLMENWHGLLFLRNSGDPVKESYPKHSIPFSGPLTVFSYLGSRDMRMSIVIYIWTCFRILLQDFNRYPIS